MILLFFLLLLLLKIIVLLLLTIVLILVYLLLFDVHLLLLLFVLLLLLLLDGLIIVVFVNHVICVFFLVLRDGLFLQVLLNVLVANLCEIFLFGCSLCVILWGFILFASSLLFLLHLIIFIFPIILFLTFLILILLMILIQLLHPLLLPQQPPQIILRYPLMPSNLILQFSNNILCIIIVNLSQFIHCLLLSSLLSLLSDLLKLLQFWWFKRIFQLLCWDVFWSAYVYWLLYLFEKLWAWDWLLLAGQSEVVWLLLLIYRKRFSLCIIFHFHTITILTYIFFIQLCLWLIGPNDILRWGIHIIFWH